MSHYLVGKDDQSEGNDDEDFRRVKCELSGIGLLYINVELGFEHWSVADWTIIPIVSLLWMLQLDVCEAICRTGAGFQWFSMTAAVMLQMRECYDALDLLLLTWTAVGFGCMVWNLLQVLCPFICTWLGCIGCLVFLQGAHGLMLACYGFLQLDGIGLKVCCRAFGTGNNVDYLSMYLDVADSTSLPYGWSRYAQFSLAIVNQIHNKFSVRKGIPFILSIAGITLVT
ncbi:hypothetical protein KIW84_050878 [Lathyrus oleraceus]|uniref:MATH domain-containing protein n=1 Tax=Pisum sativum TaxID=3888 RepID=A0A9D4WMY8_PEA|nr:hypothetical protein KIW84_050878 [Pisum sativum]